MEGTGPPIPRRKLLRDVGGRWFTPGSGDPRLPRPPKRNKRRPGKDPDSGGVPAEPDRPLNLSGGAAAELDSRTGRWTPDQVRGDGKGEATGAEHLWNKALPM